MGLAHQLWHWVKGSSDSEPAPCNLTRMQAVEDDWEREQRQRQQNALAEEYEARLQRAEDEYHVFSREEQ